MNPSNKSLGNAFERELCELLVGAGFWVHNLAQNQSGQPADIIAVKNGYAYLIDCKVCTGNKFDLRRVEENQDSAMQLWRDCGNGPGWFVIKMGARIYMISHVFIRDLRRKQACLTEKELDSYGYDFVSWVGRE